jgi:hypothetical protein
LISQAMTNTGHSTMPTAQHGHGHQRGDDGRDQEDQCGAGMA